MRCSRALMTLLALHLAALAWAEEPLRLQPARVQIATTFTQVHWVDRALTGMGHGGVVPAVSLSAHYPFSRRWHVRGDFGVIGAGNDEGGVTSRVLLGFDFSHFGMEFGAVLLSGITRANHWYDGDPHKELALGPALGLRVGPKAVHLVARWLSGDALATPGLDAALLVASQAIGGHPDLFGSLGVSNYGLELMVGWRGPGMRVLAQAGRTEIVPSVPGLSASPYDHRRIEDQSFRFGFAVAFDLWRVTTAPSRIPTDG